MGNIDALSRLPVERAPDVQEVACFILIDAHQLPINSQHVAFYTGKDPSLSKVLQNLITGTEAPLLHGVSSR